MNKIINDIFSIKSTNQFNDLCIKVFNYQYNTNKIYKSYVDELGIEINEILTYNQIPFLPIEFFKTHTVISGEKDIQTTFTSSGTSGSVTSKHHIFDLSVYERSFLKGFNQFYGSPKDYTILSLLPSYMERTGSSLVYMVQRLSEISNKKENGFYLFNHEDLYEKLNDLEKRKEKSILFGVSFALMDFFKTYKLNLKYTTIIETGGMKGQREEITKEELHSILRKGSGLKKIHSEYGMTELLSQAYSTGNNIYKTPEWMKIIIRDTNDPFTYLDNDSTGGINVIDLANYYSCSFIETKDLGKVNNKGEFEILGRFDQSDIRGCNLMVL